MSISALLYIYIYIEWANPANKCQLRFTLKKTTHLSFFFFFFRALNNS